MDNFPLQMILFGFADRIIEPFCYGCAGFLLTIRMARSVPTKLFFIALTILCFLWMDDIWIALGNRSAKMALASDNQTVTALFAEEPQVGQAEFDSGGQSGLWDNIGIDAWDVSSAVVFVPLAFYVGLLLTRRWRDEQARTEVHSPPPKHDRMPPPPPMRTGVWTA
jgi:hypothetical protein